MFGLNYTFINTLSLVIALLFTIYIISVKIPFDKGTDEHQALRLCRISFALLLWSFGFGLIGLAFTLVSFVLAIIGIVKGRTLYGVMLIIGCVVIPVLSLINTFYFAFKS